MDSKEAKAQAFDLLRQKEIIEARLQQTIRLVNELEKKEAEAVKNVKENDSNKNGG